MAARGSSVDGVVLGPCCLGLMDPGWEQGGGGEWGRRRGALPVVELVEHANPCDQNLAQKHYR